MVRFRGRPQPAEGDSHECEYRQGVARVRIELEAAQAMHGRNVPVNAAKVLDLLNPQGMWRYIDRETEPMAAQPDDDDVDPVTGCKPVTARPQTGLDKVQDAVNDARGGPAPVSPQGFA